MKSIEGYNIIPTLRSEHLTDDVKPIMASVINPENMDSLSKRIITRISSEGIFVDYYGQFTQLDKNKILNGGMDSFVISKSDEEDKYSTRYANCTGIAAVGTSSESGEEVSILSHQDPHYVFYSSKYTQHFTDSLTSSLEDISSRVLPGSLDIVIFGGNHYPRQTARAEDYKNSLKILQSIISATVRLDPTVVLGPKRVSGATDVYLDTQERRLYMVQERGQSNNEGSFAPDLFPEIENKWGDVGIDNKN